MVNTRQAPEPLTGYRDLFGDVFAPAGFPYFQIHLFVAFFAHARHELVQVWGGVGSQALMPGLLNSRDVGIRTLQKHPVSIDV